MCHKTYTTAFWHVRNAIETAEFYRSRSVEQAKQGYGVTLSRMVIGAVGRLSSEKGFDNLILGVAALVEKGHDLEL